MRSRNIGWRGALIGLSVGLLGAGTAWGEQAAADDLIQWGEQWKEKAQCEQRRAESALQQANELRQRVATLETRAAQMREQLARGGPAGEGEVMIRENILFPFGQAEPAELDKTRLGEIVEVVKARPDLVVHIEGHTDDRGTAQFNEELSQKRAEHVKQQLVELGVAPERVVTKAEGESDPQASNDTPEGRAMNRRVELIIQESPTR